MVPGWRRRLPCIKNQDWSGDPTQTLRLLHTETPKSGTNTMSLQWGLGPIFCSENSLALNSEGLEVPKDTEAGRKPRENKYYRSHHLTGRLLWARPYPILALYSSRHAP